MKNCIKFVISKNTLLLLCIFSVSIQFFHVRLSVNKMAGQLMLGSGKNRSTLPPFQPSDVFFFTLLFVNFFFHSCSFSDEHSFPPYCSATEFQHSKLEVLFYFSFFYFIPFITPFDGSYKKVPFYLRLFPQKFDSCVVW